ncbi:MAG TPA: SH3 domain-containing protein, partial [Aggregatilineaceae bacterium]|nr:SH3 domain-containing protein [Aggregatilineaceae bacterium]
GTGGGGATPPPPPPTGIRGRVMGNLRIRQQPTILSQKIGLMPWGTEVDLIGINGARNWYQVNHGGVIGWSFAPWIWLIQGSIDQLPTTDGT